MALRSDPSGTTRIRRGFDAELAARWRALARAVIELVVEDDVFGLEPPETLKFNGWVASDGPDGPPDEETLQALDRIAGAAWASLSRPGPTANARPRKTWAFLQNPDKVDKFREWLQGEVDNKVLSTGSQPPWTAKWVESAYKLGARRAFADAVKRGAGKLKKAPKVGTPDFEAGRMAQFVTEAFSQPEQLQKVRLLATRSFEDLKGVTAQMAAKMNRVLSDGVAHGRNPRVIARQLVKEVGLSKERALTVARTEVIHAHAEGQLDSFTDLGVEEVGVYAEWSTAEDEKVCKHCEALEGQVFKVKEARGLIPRHPNCRCAWIPAIDVDIKHRARNLQRALKRSIGKRDGKLKPTTWAGSRLVKRALDSKAKGRGK